MGKDDGVRNPSMTNPEQVSDNNFNENLFFFEERPSLFKICSTIILRSNNIMINI